MFPARHRKAVLTIFAAITEFERERIGERIREAKRHQRRTGQYLGGDRLFGRGIGDYGVLTEDSGAAAMKSRGSKDCVTGRARVASPGSTP